MVRSSIGLTLVALSCGCMMPGCGGSSATPTGAASGSPQHRGQVQGLPGGKGFVEIVLEPGASDKQGKLVAYFTRSDGSGAGAVADFGDLQRWSVWQDVPADLQALHRLEKARFESEPTLFPAGRPVDGFLSASLGGGDVKLTFRSR